MRDGLSLVPPEIQRRHGSAQGGPGHRNLPLQTSPSRANPSTVGGPCGGVLPHPNFELAHQDSGLCVQYLPPAI